MAKLGGKIRELFRKGLASSFFDDLEDTLIEADLGPQLAVQLTQQMRHKKPKDADELLGQLGSILAPYLKSVSPELTSSGPNLWLFLGVNGVGKTTSMAKVAAYFKAKGITKIVAAAGDTFRAAASQQLALHGQKIGFRVVTSQSGGDSSAVVHDTITTALANNDELILVDTAGRMHNKSELLHELRKIDKTILARIASENYKRLLVIDANTGQNGLRQAEVFNEALNLSGIILTKFEGTAKGGVVVAIGQAFGLPIYFVGTGEQSHQLEPFDATRFLQQLLAP
jgi:fused signal recognition particle receptor